MKRNTSETKQKKNKNATLMYILWSAITVIVSLLPLLIFILVKQDKYFKTKENVLSVSIGFILCAFLCGIIFLKKTKILSGMVGFVIFAIIVTLLKPVIDDLYIISWLCVLGLGLSKITGMFVDKWDRMRTVAPTLQAQEESTNNLIAKITEIQNSINGRG